MSKPTVSAAGGAMPAEGRKTRRTLLRLFGAAPALAILPAAASPPTTQLSALIEAHRAAHTAFCAAIDPLEAAEPDEETVIPGFGGDDEYEASGRPGDIVERLELEFAAELKKTATLSALSPELGEKARAVLEARKTFCLARLEEAFADHAVAEAAYNSASDAEDEAIMAICQHRCSSLEEAAIRAKYLVDYPLDLQTEHIDALLASFLPEGLANV